MVRMSLNFEGIGIVETVGFWKYVLVSFVCFVLVIENHFDCVNAILFHLLYI